MQYMLLVPVLKVLRCRFLLSVRRQLAGVPTGALVSFPTRVPAAVVVEDVHFLSFHLLRPGFRLHPVHQDRLSVGAVGAWVLRWVAPCLPCNR